MSPTLILQALVTYGPTVLPLIQKVSVWIKENKTEVTPEDLTELIEYGRKTSVDYLAEAEKAKAAIG